VPDFISAHNLAGGLKHVELSVDQLHFLFFRQSRQFSEPVAVKQLKIMFAPEL
jgi:hypothetical protein